jgi:hypothetical protein
MEPLAEEDAAIQVPAYPLDARRPEFYRCYPDVIETELWGKREAARGEGEGLGRALLGVGRDRFRVDRPSLEPASNSAEVSF